MPLQIVFLFNQPFLFKKNNRVSSGKALRNKKSQLMFPPPRIRASSLMNSKNVPCCSWISSAMVPKTPRASLVPRGGAWRFGGSDFWHPPTWCQHFVRNGSTCYIIYRITRIYIYTNMDLSGRSPRSTLHVFQHSCTRHWKFPCLSSYHFSFSLFRQWFHPVNPKGEWQARIHWILIVWIS